MTQRPPKASSLSRIHDHTQTHRTRYDFSGRVISPTRGPLLDNTQQQTDIHAHGGIRTHIPSKQAAAVPRLRPRGHCDRRMISLGVLYKNTISCWNHTVSEIEECLSVERCWNDTGRGKPKYSKGGFTHGMPRPCRAATGLECDFSIWFTQCGRVWFTLHTFMD
jgi:hypothetical protein